MRPWKGAQPGPVAQDIFFRDYGSQGKEGDKEEEKEEKEEKKEE